MAGMAAYLQNQLRSHLFRTASFAKPGALYIALFVGGVEVSGGGYQRVNLPPGDANWSAEATDGQTKNLVDVVFGSPTTLWGQVNEFAIFDALTAGNMLFGRTAITPKNVNAGDGPPSFPAGWITIDVDTAGVLGAYLQNQLRAHIFRTGSFAKPAVLAIALYAGAAEVSGGNYARIALNPGDANWSAEVTDGQTKNSATITFNPPTATWGAPVDNMAIFDALAGGNLLFGPKPLLNPKNIGNGDPGPQFDVGTLSIDFDI